MALPKIVSGLAPKAAVGQAVALGQVVTIGIAGEVAIGIVDHGLIEGVVFPQSGLIHVLVGADAGLGAIGAVHDREVVVAGRHAIPCLAGLLEVAEVLVLDAELVSQVAQAAEITARTATRAMDIAVGIGLVVGAFYHHMVPQHTRAETATHVVGVVRPVTGTQFGRRGERSRFRRERDAAAKGTVAVSRRAYASLYLHVAQQRGVTVHVGPEHALVLGRVEGHTVESHVNARVAGTADAHVGGSGAQAVLAPSQHAWSLGEEERQLLAGLREFLQLGFLDLRRGVWSPLLAAHAFHHYFGEFLQTQ